VREKKDIELCSLILEIVAFAVDIDVSLFKLTDQNDLEFQQASQDERQRDGHDRRFEGTCLVTGATSGITSAHVGGRFAGSRVASDEIWAIKLFGALSVHARFPVDSLGGFAAEGLAIVALGEEVFASLERIFAALVGVRVALVAFYGLRHLNIGHDGGEQKD